MYKLLAKMVRFCNKLTTFTAKSIDYGNNDIKP